MLCTVYSARNRSSSSQKAYTLIKESQITELNMQLNILNYHVYAMKCQVGPAGNKWGVPGIQSLCFNTQSL